MPHRWDPERYLQYADERGRPFVELLARVGTERPRSGVGRTGGAPAAGGRGRDPDRPRARNQRPW